MGSYLIRLVLVFFKLDTYNNRRLNYEFFVNPHGVQHDTIFNKIRVLLLSN
jgi:hypothetical protein